MDLKDHDEKYGQQGLSRQLGSAYYKSILLDSGVFGLNIAHGIGGIKTGSVVQLMGPPGLGKSSIAYRLVANGMAAGMSGFIVDTEGGINEPILMDTLEDYGVDLTRPDLPLRFATATNLQDVKWKDGKPVQDNKKPILTLERIVPMIEDWVCSTKISPNGAVVVIDSLDFLLSDVMIGSTVDTATVALIARRMKFWLKSFVGTIRGSGSMLVFIHQVSSKIDPAAHDTETFTGGNALRHAAHFALRLKDIGQEKVGEDVVGRRVRAFITKSKQGLPYRTFEYVIRYDVGPDNIGAVFDYSKRLKLITGDGAWVTVPSSTGPQKINGKEKVRQYWMDNPAELRFMQDLVFQKVQGNLAEVAPAMSDEERVQYEAVD